MLKSLKEFWNALFRTPTVIDDVVQRTHKATVDVQFAEAAIERARYQKHMGLYELKALEDWNHGRVLEKLGGTDAAT